jgi:hypothetical protein
MNNPANKPVKQPRNLRLRRTRFWLALTSYIVITCIAVYIVIFKDENWTEALQTCLNALTGIAMSYITGETIMPSSEKPNGTNFFFNKNKTQDPYNGQMNMFGNEFNSDDSEQD